MELFVWFVAAFGVFAVYHALKRCAKSPIPLLNYIFLLAPVSFMWGYFFNIGVDMWAQDMLGLEAYLALVTEHWMGLPPVVGMLIALGSAAMCWGGIKAVRAKSFQLPDGSETSLAEMEEKARKVKNTIDSMSR